MNHDELISMAQSAPDVRLTTAQAGELVAEFVRMKNTVAEVLAANERLLDERNALAAQVAGIKDEISDFCAALDGMLLADLTTEQIADDLEQRLSHYEVPQHHLREVRAEAGRAGFVAGYSSCWFQHCGTRPPEHATTYSANQYAETILNGKE